MRCTQASMSVSLVPRPGREIRSVPHLESGGGRPDVFVDLLAARVEAVGRRHLDRRIHRDILCDHRLGISCWSQAERAGEGIQDATNLLVADVDLVKVDVAPPVIVGELLPLGRDRFAVRIASELPISYWSFVTHDRIWSCRAENAPRLVPRSDKLDRREARRSELNMRDLSISGRFLGREQTEAKREGGSPRRGTRSRTG